MYIMANNPYTPGAGHTPRYIAGRTNEIQEFKQLLAQDVIMQNLVITGLRGIGKTVLLTSLKPVAVADGWLWTVEDCSEQISTDEESIAKRLITDLSLLTSNVYIELDDPPAMGFGASPTRTRQYLNYDYLMHYYAQAPGHVGDKLKRLFEYVWNVLKTIPSFKGIVFAYDEAQNLSDQAQGKQYPLSVLLDLFQYLQRNQVQFMLVLTGLPTILAKLIDARTYSERFFKIVNLERLSSEDSRKAILEPLSKQNEVRFTDETVNTIVEASGGYPYYIQFFSKEAYDIFAQQLTRPETQKLPIETIVQKLDNSFFTGRWQRATDRVRELMYAIAKSGSSEFGLREISEQTAQYLEKRIAPAQVLRHFKKLIDDGLLYKSRRGNYAFAVPLLESFILRNYPQVS
jgi:AAA ATPase domain